MDWRICALLSAVFAALTAIFAKIGVRDINSNLATGLFLLLSGAATGLSWLFYFRALQLGNASKVAPIDKLSVAITIFLSILILHEPADPKVILGGLLITAGSFVLLM